MIIEPTTAVSERVSYIKIAVRELLYQYHNNSNSNNVICKAPSYMRILLSVQCNVQHRTEYKFTLASGVRPSGVRPPGDYGQHCELSFGPIFTKIGT